MYKIVLRIFVCACGTVDYEKVKKRWKGYPKSYE